MIVLNILLYYLVIIPISLLPFPVLYFISDFLYLLIYHIVGYRKKVVISNIQNSFPEKTEKDCIKISKLFYRHFCDLVVESLKAFTISERQVQKRVVCRHPELIDMYFEQNRSVIIAGGHYNNWELFAVAVDKIIKHDTVGIYTPLRNKFFDDKMRSTRSKYGLQMVATREVKRFFEENKHRLTATIFGVDQSPSNPKSAYWMTFLNQETGVQFGTEKFAKEYGYPVLYGRLNKVKRGHYELEFVLVTDNPGQMAYGEITEKVTRLLEKDIQAGPQYWLWTHRRWKQKRPVSPDA
ncbi:MAG: lysophospholipid acyltransferase family protein [Bacteroidia bacterium]